jgi:hypothetical protein
MNGELSSTITTSTIWICTAIILAEGLFRMNGDASFLFAATVVIMAGSTLSTFFVWRRPRLPEAPRGFEVVVPAPPVESK